MGGWLERFQIFEGGSIYKCFGSGREGASVKVLDLGGSICKGSGLKRLYL